MSIRDENRFACLPNLCFGDGRAYSVGDQRILGMNANYVNDYKTAKLGSWLWPSHVAAGGFDPPEWSTFFAGPVFLGFDQMTSGVTRSLTVAPFWRSSDGGDAYLRVVVSRSLPSYIPSVSPDDVPSFGGTIHPGEAEIAEWTTTSTTWATADAATLSLGCKHLQYGYVWLYVEGSGSAQCRGLSQMAEGVRVVV